MAERIEITHLEGQLLLKAESNLLGWGHLADIFYCENVIIGTEIFPASRSENSEVKALSRVRPFATPWTVAYQASPPMGFSRQESRSGLPFLSPYLGVKMCGLL